MLDAFLVPANTVVTAKGDSAPLDISEAASRVFLLTLSVSSIVEQEAIEVSLFTSADGTTWETKPVASLPQKFYLGEYPLLVDLSQSPSAKFVRGIGKSPAGVAVPPLRNSKLACVCVRFPKRRCRKPRPKRIPADLGQTSYLQQL
jgi:hypothetical protein